MRTLFFLALLFSTHLNAQDSTKVKSKKVTTSGEYIILKDSTRIAGVVSRKKDKISVDGREYSLVDLLGFKQGKVYWAIFDDHIFWVWTLGKIQAYSLRETIKKGPESIDRSSSICFIRKDTGSLNFYTPRNLLHLIQDNEAAVKEFHLNYKTVNNDTPIDLGYNKLKKVLAVYNGTDDKGY